MDDHGIESRYLDLYAPFLATAAEIETHNRESAALWDAYRRDEPTRVPAVWGCMNPMRLMYADRSFRFPDYWHVPDEMLRLQATAAALSRRIMTTDDVKPDPDTPAEGRLDFHPFGDEAYWECPVEFFDRDQPRVHHRFVAEKVPPEEVAIPDPLAGGFMDEVVRMYEEMSRRVREGVRFAGLGFRPEIGAGGMLGTYGLFNSALQMRGSDLFLDIVEDPGYVHGLLDRVGRGYVRRVQAWEEKTGRKNKHYAICYDHGIDMMSMRHYEEFLVPVYRRVKNALGAEAYDREIEHCGRGEEVIRYKHERFGVNRFTNLNATCLDLERLRHDLGPEVYMQVTIHPGLVHTGPVDAIRQAVRDMLTPALKGRGRLTVGIQGDNFRAPLEHIRALYEAVVEYGRY